MNRTALVLSIACLVAGAAHAAADAAGCDGAMTTRIVPLPVYATLPNEGDTFGLMPVFLRICDENQRTRSIIAPSFTWNDVIHWTGTFRFYDYPGDDQSLTAIASLSSRINSGVLLRWGDLPKAPGALTTEIELRWQRSAFYRFFGFGSDTAADAETGYTRVRAHGTARVGLNFGRHWNAGASLLLHHDGVQDLGVPGLPISRRVFPDTPGMGGSTILGQGVDIRYDTRPNAESSIRGFFAGAGIDAIEGLRGSPPYLRGALRVRALLPELSWLHGAARLDVTSVGTPHAPFYDQSSLGGAFILRGFTEDRFIDQHSWTIEVEQRIRVFETRIYGVVADWRIDPFVAAGQVFRSLPHAFSNPQVAVGVGFRAWVRPNVVGRVDVASAGEGLKVYVEIGYPY